LVTSICFAVIGCEPTKSPQNNATEEPTFGTLMSNPTDLYQSVVPGRTFTFPKDHQAHHDFRHEWWYLTANLVGESGQEYGIQWTQFRFGSHPEIKALDNAQSSDWNSHHVYMAHSALTTESLHLSAEKWSRAHPRLAGIDNNPYAIFLDDWRWQSQSTSMFPASLTVSNASLSKTDTDRNFGFRLSLDSTASFQLQGDKGYSIKSGDGAVASYYYSQPYIDVTGEVTYNGVTEAVTGQGWLDREWSTQFLLESQQGWDWFALRLSDELTLVLFQLRPTGDGEWFKSARLMHKQGNGFAIQGEDITLSPIRNLKGYPTEWQISVPKHDINLLVKSLNPNASMGLSIDYWEGPVQFSGSHKGRGYLEMTGY
jgi:predicted secreted hydrolase